MQYKDQISRIIDLPATPQRIISLVPSQTELLIDLGLQSSLVGLTKFCVHPSNIRYEKTIVGGTKQVNYDKIKSLQPDLIICNKEENTQEIVENLSANYKVWVSDISTIEESIEMIEAIGFICDTSIKAKEICEGIKLEKELFLEFTQDKPTMQTAYLIWKDPYMVAGKNTFINTLLDLNKFQNAFVNSASRYPEIQLEELKNLDIILLSSEPFPFKDLHIKLIKEHTRAQVLLVDGEYFSWYGSRLQKAFRYFRTLH